MKQEDKDKIFIDFVKNLTKTQMDMEPEFNDITNKIFDELLYNEN